MTSKTELRRSLLQARLAMPAAERVRKSSIIVQRLMKLINWAEITAVHCYEPIGRLNEVDIRPAVAFLTADYPGIALYTSRKINGDWQVIPQTGSASTSEPLFDLIIIPMLGFDEQLHRLGYGGGYYDRLLAAQPQARKIGVCFETGKVASLPVEPHDITLDAIITERQLYRPLYELR